MRRYFPGESGAAGGVLGVYPVCLSPLIKFFTKVSGFVMILLIVDISLAGCAA